MGEISWIGVVLLMLYINTYVLCPVSCDAGDYMTAEKHQILAYYTVNVSLRLILVKRTVR